MTPEEKLLALIQQDKRQGGSSVTPQEKLLALLEQDKRKPEAVQAQPVAAPAPVVAPGPAPAPKPIPVTKPAPVPAKPLQAGSAGTPRPTGTQEISSGRAKPPAEPPPAPQATKPQPVVVAAPAPAPVISAPVVIAPPAEVKKAPLVVLTPAATVPAPPPVKPVPVVEAPLPEVKKVPLVVLPPTAPAPAPVAVTPVAVPLAAQQFNTPATPPAPQPMTFPSIRVSGVTITNRVLAVVVMLLIVVVFYSVAGTQRGIKDELQRQMSGAGEMSVRPLVISDEPVPPVDVFVDKVNTRNFFSPKVVEKGREAGSEAAVPAGLTKDFKLVAVSLDSATPSESMAIIKNKADSKTYFVKLGESVGDTGLVLSKVLADRIVLKQRKQEFELK